MLCDRVCLGIGTLCVPRPETNIKSALNWNAKLEGRRGIMFQTFLMQDAARDEYAHAILCTLGEIVPSGYGWKVMRPGLPGYWHAACSSARDKYQIGAKLEC
jgi:hypothetical protein